MFIPFSVSFLLSDNLMFRVNTFSAGHFFVLLLANVIIGSSLPCMLANTDAYFRHLQDNRS